MKKTSGIFLALMVLLTLNSCLENDNKRGYLFTYEPVIAGDTEDAPTILTFYTTFRVSNLPKDVEKGGLYDFPF